MAMDEQDQKPLSAAERMRLAAQQAQLPDLREAATSAPTSPALPSLELERTAPSHGMSEELEDVRKALDESKATLREFNSLKENELKVMADLSKAQQRINADLESLRAAREKLGAQAESWERSYREGQADLSRTRKRLGIFGALGAGLVVLGVLVNTYTALRLHQREETLEKVLARWESQYLQPQSEAKGRSGRPR